MEVGVKLHAPAALPPGKTRYPWYNKLGGPLAGLEGTENLTATGSISPDSTARSK